ncbi:putative acetyl CoA carboxylase, partial [Pseudoloma neurophilia]
NKNILEEQVKDVKNENILEEQVKDVENKNILEEQVKMHKIYSHKQQSENIFIKSTDNFSKFLSYSSLSVSSTISLSKYCFTISLILNHSIGIGAYLNILQKRIILNNNSFLLLTGYKSLNKLLNTNYKNNLQLGGYNVLKNEGTVHRRSVNSYHGIKEVFLWMIYSTFDCKT